MSQFFKINDRFGVNLDKIIFWELYPEDDKLVIYFDHAITDYMGEFDVDEKALITTTWEFRGPDAKYLLKKLSSEVSSNRTESQSQPRPEQDN